jgi:hypothetical protein
LLCSKKDRISVKCSVTNQLKEQMYMPHFRLNILFVWLIFMPIYTFWSFIGNIFFLDNYPVITNFNSIQYIFINIFKCTLPHVQTYNYQIQISTISYKWPLYSLSEDNYHGEFRLRRATTENLIPVLSVLP